MKVNHQKNTKEDKMKGTYPSLKPCMPTYTDHMRRYRFWKPD